MLDNTSSIICAFALAAVTPQPPICIPDLIRASLRSSHGLDLTGYYPKTWQYMLMVGQNSDVYGVVNSADGVFRSAVLEYANQNGKDNSYVKSELLKEALNRIKERKLLGNFSFYVKKLNIAYNDGYFHNVQNNLTDDIEHNLLYDLLEKENGRYYQLTATILQIAWDGVLLLLFLSLFLLRKDLRYRYFEIAILGISAYIMLFEGRSKYLYMFLPMYLVAAGMVLPALSRWLSAHVFTNIRSQRIRL